MRRRADIGISLSMSSGKEKCPKPSTEGASFALRFRVTRRHPGTSTKHLERQGLIVTRPRVRLTVVIAC